MFVLSPDIIVRASRVADYYDLRMGRGNTFRRICLSVSLFVMLSHWKALTQKVYLLIFAVKVRIQTLKVRFMYELKVIGSRSRSQEQKSMTVSCSRVVCLALTGSVFDGGVSAVDWNDCTLI